MRAELEILGLDVSRHVVDTYAEVPRRARGDPQPRPAPPAQQGRAAGRRGQGRHPDPADPVRSPGGLPDPRRRHRPGRRDVLRGRPGPLRRHRLRLLAAGRPRRAAPDRPPGRLPACHRCLGAAGARTRCGSARDRRGPRGDRRGARGLRGGARPRRPQPEAEPARPAGCWSTPAGSRCRPTPTSSRPAPASRGSATRSVRPQAVAPQPREPRDEPHPGTRPTRP